MKPIEGLSLIAAMAANRVIGNNNEIPWRLPSDMKRFKALTDGHPVIMGRKTWESIPEKFRPLPGRTNIVVTRQAGYQAPGATVVCSLDDAFVEAIGAPGSREVFIIGGAGLYAQCLPMVSTMYLTYIDASVPGDALFPEFGAEEWFVWESRAKTLVPGDQFPTSFEKLRRSRQ